MEENPYISPTHDTAHSSKNVESTEIASQTISYLPFGRFTLAFHLTGVFLAIWAFAPQYVYHASFVPKELGWTHESALGGYHDYAGYVGFIFISCITILIAFLVIFAYKATLKTHIPKLKPLILGLTYSTLLFSIPWAMVGWFYDNYRFRFPSDGNWAAISGICTIGLLHYYCWYIITTVLSPKIITIETSHHTCCSKTCDISAIKSSIKIKIILILGTIFWILPGLLLFSFYYGRKRCQTCGKITKL